MASRDADHRSRARYDDSRGGRRDYGSSHRSSYQDRRYRDYGDDRRDDRHSSRTDSRNGEHWDQRHSRSPRRTSPSRDRMKDHRDRSPRDRRTYRNGHDRQDTKRDRPSLRDGRDDHARDRSPNSSHKRKRSVSSSSSYRRRDEREPAKAPRLSEEERKKKEEAEKKQKALARLEAWKAKKAKTDNGKRVVDHDQKVDSPKTPLKEPNGNTSNSNIPSPTLTSEEHAKPTAAKPSPGATDQIQREPTKPVVKPQTSSSTLSQARLGRPDAALKPTVANIPAPPLKPTVNVSSFGLKAKAPIVEQKGKNTLLMAEEDVKTRTFEKLPDYVPEDHPIADGEDDVALGDIASDDEDAAAAQMAAAEKRRLEATTREVEMVEAPPVPDTTQEDEELDPLDAFMATLHPEEPKTAHNGEAFYGDETEVNMEAVDTEDLLAPTIAKKKREIPVVDHSKVDYLPFQKNLYVEPAELRDLTTEELADLRLELDGIKTKPKNVVAPVTKWGQMGLPRTTLDTLEVLKYTTPTPIQAQAIPLAESGLDMIAVAKTGSGKTLAFGIPLIRHILAQPPLSTRDGPIGLILAPTRELAVQIVKELQPFLKAANLKAACAYGGAPIKDQIADLKRGGVHILCATPGRLIDLLMSNSGRILSFKRITYVVIDEADRMFDMGFEPQVTKIVGNIRPDRQTVLFSATFPKNITTLARKILDKPAEVIVGGRSVVRPEITQVVKVIEAKDKLNQLLLHLGELYQQDDDSRTLVFVETQTQAEDLLFKLMKKGYPCNSIHGGKDQTDRSDAINDFKNGVIPILIATSVAARGLDVTQLKLVVNYDCPTHLEDYVHRCGRTGRAGNTGTAITFVEPSQARFAVHVLKALTQSGVTPPDELKAMVDKFTEEVKAGKEKWGHSNSGFTGKGLDRLDEERHREKMREKRAFKTGDDKDDDSDDEEVVIPVGKKETPTSVPTAPTPNMPVFEEIVVKKTERPGVDGPGNPLSQVNQAAQDINNRLSKRGAIHPGQPIDNKGPDAGAFHATVSINDFHQKARWAVTNRTNVSKILDSTGVSITSKGVYYPEGKFPKEGEPPKLYILVEGDTENVVTAAVRELQRLLREAQAAAMDGDSGRTVGGRYNVV